MDKKQLVVKNINPLNGDYFPPSSKSHTFRALLLSLYSKNGTIINRLKSDDVDNFVDIIKKMGFIIVESENEFFIKKPKKLNIGNYYNFNNSGTALRFMVSLLGLLKPYQETVLIDGDNQLKKRKIKKLLEALSALGLEYEMLSLKEIPFNIKKNINHGTTRISGKSSQFLSSLLLTLAFLDEKSTIYIDELNEKPYIDMTLFHLARIGVKVENYNYKKMIIHPIGIIQNYEFKIPSDFSSATYIILATLLSKGDVNIYKLDLNDTQGDKAILKFIEKVGAKYRFNNNILRLMGRVKNGASFDMNSTPDLLPALVFFLVQYPYYFEFTNLEPIRYKETDRVEVLYQNLKKMGVKVSVSKDKLSFVGNPELNNVEITASNDHRIIMGATLLGMKKGNAVTISEIKNLESSYPKYLSDIEKLGAIVKCSS